MEMIEKPTLLARQVALLKYSIFINIQYLMQISEDIAKILRNNKCVEILILLMITNKDTNFLKERLKIEKTALANHIKILLVLINMLM